MAQIDILVGTVTGNAQRVADALAARLRSLDHQVDFITPDALPDLSRVWLICTSNTGVGDLPPGLQTFYEHLRSNSAYLGGVKFVLVNLGDSAYQSFGGAGKALEEALLDLGAKPLAPTLVVDAIYINDPVREALNWLASWETLL